MNFSAIQRLSLSILLALAPVFAPADENTPDPFASPYAVKGGRMRFFGGRPPKSYNAYTDNNTYTRMTFDLMYETLLTTDPVTMEFEPYLADTWQVSDDHRTFTFHLDERAKWSDGTPVLAEDVKWTFDIVLDPASDAGAYFGTFSLYESPEILDERTVRFKLKDGVSDDWRALLNVATFEILPKHAFENKRFAALDLVNAVVSGPYKLSKVEEHKRAVFERRKDWWRAGFICERGHYNFDNIEMKYYEDNENAFEAFKKDELDFYPVYTAHIMATGTRGEAFNHNWIVKRTIQNKAPVGYQGFAMNLRRKPFDDLRVRQALSLLLDRETINRTMMFSAYFLQNSFYRDLYDAGHPCQNTLWPYDPGRAKKLLAEAGWVLQDAPPDGIVERISQALGLSKPKKRLMKDGQPFHMTFLSRAASEDKFLAFYKPVLEDAGITFDIVRKDWADWMRSIDAFDFDITWASFAGSVFRNPEMIWSAAEADRQGGNNITGIKIPEVEALCQKEKHLYTVAERNEVYRQIDKLLCDQCPYVFLWNTDKTRLLYWNRFGMPPAPLGMYGSEVSAVSYWWYDPDAARELDEAMKNNTFLPSPGDVEWKE